MRGGDTGAAGGRSDHLLRLELQRGRQQQRPVPVRGMALHGASLGRGLLTRKEAADVRCTLYLVFLFRFIF